METSQTGTRRGHVIVVGNEKGGSGKSTAAMHIIVALMRQGRSVGSLDLDVRQRTLSRYVENRALFLKARELDMPVPDHLFASPESDEKQWLEDAVALLAARNDVVVIDTPGNDSPLNRLGHGHADTLVTPMNDSFVDLDVLARVDPDTLSVTGASHYSAMVFEVKKSRLMRDRHEIDWIVMRNRLSHLDARNKQEVERLLGELMHRLRFRAIPGFGERVIFRELFLQGLTMMDVHEAVGGEGMTRSHLAARQEVRALVESLRLPALVSRAPPH